MNKYLFSVTGDTITRSQYWTVFLISALYGAVIGIAAAVLQQQYNMSENDMLITTLIGFIPLIWVGIFTSINRIRDTGLSGWWYLIQLIPYVGIIVGFAFALIPTGWFCQFKSPFIRKWRFKLPAF